MPTCTTQPAIHLFEFAEVELLDSPDFGEAILCAWQVLEQKIPHGDAQQIGFRQQAPASLWDGSDDGPWAAASFAWSSGTASGVAGWRSAGCWLATVILVALADVDSKLFRQMQLLAPDKAFLVRLFVALRRIARFAFRKLGNNCFGAYGHVHSCDHSAAQRYEATDETEHEHFLWHAFCEMPTSKQLKRPCHVPRSFKDFQVESWRSCLVSPEIKITSCVANGLRTFVADKPPEENSVTQKLVCVLNLVTSMFACSGEKTDPSKTSSPALCSPCDANQAVAPPTPESKGQQEVFFNSEYLKFWTRAALLLHAWRAELTLEEDTGIVEATINARTLCGVSGCD